MASKELKCKNIHLQCGIGVDMIIKSSLVRRTLDNVTCVMIAFNNFENILFPVVKTDNSISVAKVLDVIESRERYNTIHTAPSYNDKKKVFTETKKILQTETKIKEDFRKNDYNSENKLINSYDSFKNGTFDTGAKKSLIRKKLVSLDLSSSKKKTQNNLNTLGKLLSGKDNSKDYKDFSIIKKSDSSEFSEKKLYFFNTPENSSSIKNTNLRYKENSNHGYLSSVKKINSFKSLNDNKLI